MCSVCVQQAKVSAHLECCLLLYCIVLFFPGPGWYTEKYRRDEGDLDGHIQKLYLRSAEEARSNMPQMAAAIRGQSMDLDGRMDKMVWGGKAQLPKNGSGSGGGGGSGSGISNGNNDNNNNGTEASLSAADDSDKITTSGSPGEEEKPTRKRRKRKRKKHNNKNNNTTNEKSEDERQQQQQKKLVLQSSIAGIAVGAVAVAAVSVLIGGNGGRK